MSICLDAIFEETETVGMCIFCINGNRKNLEGCRTFFTNSVGAIWLQSPSHHRYFPCNSAHCACCNCRPCGFGICAPRLPAPGCPSTWLWLSSNSTHPRWVQVNGTFSNFVLGSWQIKNELWVGYVTVAAGFLLCWSDLNFPQQKSQLGP